MIKRRSLGQHFLITQSIVKSIIDSAGITKDDIVLEIGTGHGILTLPLCRDAKQVISVEKDPLLYSQARNTLSHIPNLVLEEGDAFKKSIEFTILVSNLPYSESRTAIEWLVQRKFKRAIVMVQKEFAQKLTKKNGKERRAISVLANYCLDIENIMDVKNTNFRPPPKVDSIVLSIIQKHVLSSQTVHAVNKLFSFKRKTIRNIGKKMGIEIDSDKRLEEIPDGEIIEIAKRIQ
ncbi:16S rRNA (adenine(1518)-N(6)/adenine(1519)-N(6))-dimethyltransferase RsmA [Candidatus Nitrosotalea okcheonensis]|uniref:Ribosomal RNA adenine methylase transferase n=1 Tax=Candidatus Nitrosotalea okcheonensis TaxID=1903276 RepID=A0A2H1FFP7_9ARCH|nr:16S rRNA (adenine(1518)-N(6)/adenine(1519)-N(6))-dimethyltransferase RsmA [Candidatus Nitrosotalea okcheonensis]SMH71599.1 Ribosomal RNA adenine methylase transferase [Candidatus Nitrosotalea okcheonensis]